MVVSFGGLGLLVGLERVIRHGRGVVIVFLFLPFFLYLGRGIDLKGLVSAFDHFHPGRLVVRGNHHRKGSSFIDDADSI